jgi:hypothetical protein
MVVVAIQGMCKGRLPVRADLYIGPPWILPDLPPDVDLIGHSYGAYIAMEYATRRPVRSLTLIAPVGLNESIGIWGWIGAWLFALFSCLPCVPSWVPDKEHVDCVRSHIQLCPPRWRNPLGHTLEGKTYKIFIGEYDRLSPPPTGYPHILVREAGHYVESFAAVLQTEDV